MKPIQQSTDVIQQEPSMRLCLVEDNADSNLEPLTLTRPTYQLLLGSCSLGKKHRRCLGHALGPHGRGAVIRPHLMAIERERDPTLAINDPEWLTRGPA